MEQNQWARCQFGQGHSFVDQQRMARWEGDYQFGLPQRFAGQAVGFAGGTGKADIEQVVLQAFELLGQRHLEQLQVDVGLFLAAAGQALGQDAVGEGNVQCRE